MARGAARGGAGANENCTVEAPGAWAFGGSLDEDMLTVDANDAGEIFIAGEFEGALGIDNVNAGNSGVDGYVAKLEAGGEPIWARAIIGDGLQRVRSVVSASDGGVVVAGRMQGLINFGSDVLDVPLNAQDGRVFFAKYDEEGLVDWAQLPGTYATEFNRSSEPSLARLPSGDIAYAFAHVGDITIAGTTHSSNQSSVVAGVMTEDGDIAWSAQIACGGGCNPRRVASDGADGFYVAGGGTDISYDGSGNENFTPPPVAAVDDAFLFHFVEQNGAGALAAATVWGGGGAASRFERMAPIEGGVVVFGQYRASQTLPIDGLSLPSTTISVTNGGDNLFVTVLDDDLRINKLFFTLGTDFNDDETARGLAVIDDVVVVAAQIDGFVDFDGVTETSAGSNDVVVATLSLPDLDVRSVDRFGDVGSQGPNDLVRRCDGFVMAGDLSGAFVLDGTMLEPPEGGVAPNDIFVARMRVPNP